MSRKGSKTKSSDALPYPAVLENFKTQLYHEVVIALEKGAFDAKISDIDLLMKKSIFTKGFVKCPILIAVKESYAVAAAARLRRDGRDTNLCGSGSCEVKAGDTYGETSGIPRKKLCQRPELGEIDKDEVPVRLPARQVFAQLSEMMARLKPLLITLDLNVKKVHSLMTLSKQKIEDGNTFGLESRETIASIAEDIVSSFSSNLASFAESFSMKGRLFVQDEAPVRLPALQVSAQLKEMMDLLKPLLINLELDAKKVHTWITLSMPKIEDGNNFGVEIQETIASIAEDIASSAASNLASLAESFSMRGKLFVQAIKHPEVEDTWRAVEYFDELQHHTLTCMVQDIRDDYVILIDHLIKNMDKIIKPRSNNTTSLYSN